MPKSKGSAAAAAPKKKKKKKGSKSAAAVKKNYDYSLNLHVDDFLVLSIGGVLGAVKVTNTRPPVARARKGPRGRTFTLTITATGAGKTTIVAKGRSSSTIFTFKFVVTVKQQLAAGKPPETLPSETATLPLLPGARLTALYDQLRVAGRDRIAGKATAVAVPPGIVIAVRPAPNVPLRIFPIRVGTARVRVAIEYLKFRMTGSPPAVWGTGAPASVQGAPTKTTILTGAGPTYSVKLVQVKRNFDFKSRLRQRFVIKVVACPGAAAAAPRA